MFSGSRRNVNLGGRKPPSRQDVLRNAEAQRRQREQARREDKAARTLQNALRAKKITAAARNEFALRSLHSLTSAEDFVYALPALNSLSPEQQLHLVRQFANSELSFEYHADLINRLLQLWSSPNLELHQEGYKVLQHQARARSTSVAQPLDLNTIITYCSTSWLEPEVATFLFSSNLAVGLQAILYLFAHKPDRAHQLVQIDALRAFYSLETLPPKIQNTSSSRLNAALYAVLRIVAAEPVQAQTLIAAILLRLPRTTKFPIDDLVGNLCDKEVMRVLASRPIEEMARYISGMLVQAPKMRAYILQKQSLFMDPMTVWNTLTQTTDISELTNSKELFHYALEAVSFMLLVSLDVEVMAFSTSLQSIAQLVREICFDLLWNHTPGEPFRIRGGMNLALVKLVRQLYFRDLRMKLFPEGFWIMSQISLRDFVRTVKATGLNDYGNNDPSAFSDSGDDDEEEDEDENEDGGERMVEEDTGDGNEGQDEYGTRDGNSGLPPASKGRGALKEQPINVYKTPACRILELTPFFVPFETRAELLYAFIEEEKFILTHGNPYGGVEVDVNRETLLSDAEILFTTQSPSLKTNLKIRMISDGEPEAGVDGGGIMKDLLTTICEECFGAKRFEADEHDDQSELKSCFVDTEQHSLVPNPVFGEKRGLLNDSMKSKYYFLGLVIGKCIYEKLLLNVEFCQTFLSKWHSFRYASLEEGTNDIVDDLAIVDPALHRGLTQICLMEPEKVASMGLDFSIYNSLGETAELVKDGANKPVTAANRLDYVWRVANYKLNTASRHQTSWFLKGVGQLINMSWLNMFDSFELSKIIGGALHPMDVDDLRLWSEVTGFPPESNAPQYFWEVLRELNLQQTADFLKFVTSVPRGPLLGFENLRPRFGIRCSGEDQSRLPTAATCFNLLKIPNYQTKEQLKEKLLYAISSSARFDLS